jgi:hypothetical protein
MFNRIGLAAILLIYSSYNIHAQSTKLTLDADIRRAWGVPYPWERATVVLAFIHQADQQRAQVIVLNAGNSRS